MTASLTTIHSSCSYLDDKLNKYNEILTFKSDNKKCFGQQYHFFQPSVKHLKNQRNCAIIPQTWGIYQHTNTCYYMKSAKPSPLKFVPLTSSGV